LHNNVGSSTRGDTTEIPEQQIVSDERWTAVQARTETVKQLYGKIGPKGGMRGRSASSLYLFSELLKCIATNR